MKKLQLIQSELKAPKGQFNSFGKYRYRNVEDILEALKPLLAKHECTLVLSDSIQLIGERYYVEAIATITDTKNDPLLINHCYSMSVKAYAREEETKKGMDGSQITGAASSYARKYALNGLFAIDDTKDADATNTHDEKSEVTEAQRDYLLSLLDTSTYEETMRKKLAIKIKTLTQLDAFELAKTNLLDHQNDSVNPSQKEINNYLKKTGKQ